MDAKLRRKHATSLRDTAHRLLAIADQIEPASPAPARSRDSRIYLCPDCGTEYRGPEWRNGDPCLTRGCVGLIGPKPSAAPACVCDTCRGTTCHPEREGFRCVKWRPIAGGVSRCPGTYTRPADLVRLRDGRTLEITPEQWTEAALQAAMETPYNADAVAIEDAAADDPIEWASYHLPAGVPHEVIGSVGEVS